MTPPPCTGQDAHAAEAQLKQVSPGRTLTPSPSEEPRGEAGSLAVFSSGWPPPRGRRMTGVAPPHTHQLPLSSYLRKKYLLIRMLALPGSSASLKFLTIMRCLLLTDLDLCFSPSLPP